MSQLPDDVRGFDFAYISWGGVCWVPDLRPWVRDIAERLAPGGRLIVAEHHPLWEILTVASADTLRVTRSYFQPDWQGEEDVGKAPQIV